MSSVVVLQLALVLSLLHGQTARSRVPRYDGHWWNEASRERQDGYVSGDTDCHQYEVHGPARRYRTGAEALKWLDDFYRKPSNLAIRVRRALSMVDGHRDPAPPAGEGQAHPGRHGYYDALYWGPAGPDTKLGFVEGYLICLPDSARLFPKSPKHYVDLIDSWYAAHRERKYDDAMVPDVLRRVRIGKH